MSLKNKKRYLENLYLLYIFFTTSLIGGLLESFYVWFRFGHFNIGGFLYGPWRPIYGVGCLILYFITKILKKRQKSDLFVFGICASVCTIFEYISSFLLELIFKRTWWNYKGDLLNINGRISLFTTIVWGFLGLFFLKHLEPTLRKSFEKFSIVEISYITFLLTALFFMDYIYSFINYI